MAEGLLQLKLSAPEHEPVEIEATEIVVPGSAGVFTVLPGHTPLLTTLTQGVLIAYRPDADAVFCAIHEGFAEVLGDRIVVLADTMELSESIDAARAQAARERAEERLQGPGHGRSVQRAEAGLSRAIARLQAQRREEY